MHSPTVLVAESDHLQRQTTELLLNEFTVVSFSSGQEALEYFQKHSPDLAIFAARMPDINGTDVCDRIKSIKRLRHIPIIITTSQQRYGTVKDLARAVRADLVLTKPLEDQDLAAQVRGLIDPESFLTPVEDAEVIERALKRLEEKSARQLEEEEDLKDLLEANQNLHRQLEALKQENRQLKEDTFTEDEVKTLRLDIDNLRKENLGLQERVAATENHDALSLDLASLKKDYADLQAQVSEQSDLPAVQKLQTELATLTESYDALKLEFEKLQKDYAAKTRASEQGDTQALKALQAELEFSKENEQRLSAQLAALEASSERVVYQGEVETLQALESLRNKQSIQQRQLETLRKHNQKLLASINEMQINQSSRRSLLDRFRS